MEGLPCPAFPPFYRELRRNFPFNRDRSSFLHQIRQQYDCYPYAGSGVEFASLQEPDVGAVNRAHRHRLSPPR